MLIETAQNGASLKGLCSVASHTFGHYTVEKEMCFGECITIPEQKQNTL